MKQNRQIVLWSVAALCLASTAAITAPGASAQTKKPAAAAEWLPLCGKCPKPTVFWKTGIGTAHAVAEAKITFKDAKENCEAYAMSENPDCDKQVKDTLREENGKVYKATADCVHGRITLATGDNLTYAGIWPNGYLKGKTRWRFVSTSYDNGHFANEDGPTNGFMVDTTSKILCPNGIGGARKR